MSVLIVNSQTNIAIDAAPRKVKLSWDASTIIGIKNYKIYRGLNPSPTSLLATTTTVSYIDLFLNNGIRYYYRITAVKADDSETDYSTDVSGTPLGVWHVEKSGTPNGFGSSTSPLLLIQSAIDLSASGETVLVGDGIFQEKLQINK